MLEKHNVSPLSLNMSNTVRLGHSIEATNVAENKSICEHNYGFHDPNHKC